ncbi:ATP-binding protein [Paraburkholderia sediminicola]|uniref:ATP-binding protein n=1 Tax=Paraburkholderia sediminicola TaxID=458836 RepID=UPI0038BE0F95
MINGNSSKTKIDEVNSRGRSDENDDEYRKVPIDLKNDKILSRKCPSVSAEYHDSSLELPENSNNPTILALPPFESQKQFAKAMTFSFAVPHSEDARKLPTQLRLLGIERISRVLVLTDAHLQLLDWIHIALRHRYRGLVPLRSLRAIAQRNYRETQRGRTRGIYVPDSSHADCITVLGISGAGKTTTLKMVLSMFPMIIEHTEFLGVPARFAQVVWIMVSCPPNGSVLTLMKGILHWFDMNLGTHYVKEIKNKANTGDLIVAVVDKLHLHHVGMLVIDEIQFAVQSAERADLMGFLTSLLNDGQCLFVLVGTPDAGELIKETIRNLRRAVSRTYIPLEHFPAAEDAKRLARNIIAIDFLPEKPDNIEEVVNTLFDVGAGSPAFMKLAWEHTQYMGERANQKKVTPALVRSAVEKAFSLVEGLLKALRNKDIVALDGYRDAAIEQMIAIREKIALDRKRRNMKLNPDVDEASEKFSKCVGMLLSLGWSEIEAEDFVRTRLMADASITVANMMRTALERDQANS